MTWTITVSLTPGMRLEYRLTIIIVTKTFVRKTDVGVDWLSIKYGAQYVKC